MLFIKEKHNFSFEPKHKTHLYLFNKFAAISPAFKEKFETNFLLNNKDYFVYIKGFFNIFARENEFCCGLN